MFCLTGCGTNREAWESLTTHELACRPFEIVVVRGVHYEARIIEGTVYYAGDPDVPLENVRVALRPLSGGEQLATTATDAKGRFTFPAYPAGWYQIETCLEGFNSVIAPVRVTDRPRGAPLALSVSLSA